jgi:hypothetical protein
MKRTIFVGSSHEGYEEAKDVCEAIKGLGGPTLDLDPQIWTTFFDTGSLTFEALEDMLRRCCAAVFIIRRDDIVRHNPESHSPVIAANANDTQLANETIKQPSHRSRGKPAYMPRGNVLVEFGLVAGRLGRCNIALCRVEDAELPSDLAGITVIDMCSRCGGPPQALSERFTDDARERLRHWASHLLAISPGIERTGVFHGYTGRWEFELQLTKWRGLSISSPSYAVVNGFLDLFICSQGFGNFGSASGTLSCRLEVSAGNPPIIADLHLFHTISNIECKKDGGLEVTSHVLGVVGAGKINDAPNAPAELRTIGSGSEPWTFKWTLDVDGSGRFKGTLRTHASGETEGDVTANKLRMVH